MELKICSFNVRNDNFTKEISKETIKQIYINLLKNYEIDILTTQEMILSTENIINEEIKDYKLVGKYRFNKFLRKFKSIQKYNEGNNIISRLPILENKTKKLPWIPKNIKDIFKGTFKYQSIIPRILTEAIISINSNERIKVINTHLSIHINTIKKSQLKKIIKEIKNSNIPVILTGDFNTNIEDKIFKKFIEEANNLGLKRVELNSRTFKKSKDNLAIDHIFIPKKWEIEEVKIVEDEFLDGYSDHFPLYIKVLVKN